MKSLNDDQSKVSENSSSMRHASFKGFRFKVLFNEYILAARGHDITCTGQI